jgi:predicted ATPase/DNA-binding SARP family transcriptional activator
MTLQGSPGAAQTGVGHASLAIRLFGPFEARLNGTSLPRLRTRKGEWLLALLLLHHGRPLERSQLAGLLWPDSSQPQALANLRLTLSDLRRSLGPEAPRLRSPAPRSLSLDLTGAVADVLSFDAAVARGDEAALQEAVALYRGPLLEGCAEEWAFQEREARQQAYLQALEHLAAHAWERGDAGAAERWLRRAVAVDPARERAQRELMRVLAASGSYAAALQSYRELRLHLHREVNAEPDPETRALFEQIRAEARQKADGVMGRRSDGAKRLDLPSRPVAPSPRRPVAERSEGSEATLTFLFTDIAGSSRLWEEEPDAMRLALERHDRFLRDAIETNRGQVFKTVGDAFCAAFETPADALDAALGAQRLLRGLPSSALATVAGMALQVRMAVHTGVADQRGGDYFGPALNRVARLLEVCHGGQVLLSGAVRELVQDDLPRGAWLEDLGRHRLRDLQRSERIYQLRHPDLPSEFLPLPSLDTLPNNLPQQVTRFIGRQREIAEVKRLLASTRLLTVTGPGGTGKTRLSLQVAADLLEGENDGIWLVELASLTNPELVPQAVAATLGVREAVAVDLRGERVPALRVGTRPESRSLTQSLVEHLRSKQLLLVLDNCEHLLTACAALADALLRACPGIQILATSRERLNVAGETTYRLQPLSTPGAGHVPVPATPESLIQFEAVRLFVDRAVAALPSFAVTDQNAPAVAQVCSRLDGVPLVIELAAARVRALPIETINERLDDRFRLLTDGSRTAPPRQQTLRALIDWSYDLLTEPEQTLLRRLSVFSGGWTLEAAEGICEGDVLDLLASLVEKSLVQYDDRGGEGRYRLLETVRQYGRERLLAAGEAEIVCGRHCDWYTALAEAAEIEMRGPDLFEWLDRLDAEHDNLRAALEWSAEHSPEVGLRLAGALWTFWAVRGHFNEGRERLARALDRAGTAGPTLARARALAGAGALACFQGDRVRTGVLCEESLAAARGVGSQHYIALSLLFLSIFQMFYRGDPAQATKLAEESVAAAREQGEQWLIAICLDCLGMATVQAGDLDRGEALLEESLSLLRGLENRWLIAFPLIHLGFLATCRGDLERATALGRESLALQDQLADHWGMTLSLEVLAAAAGQGQPERAARLLGAAEALLESLGAIHSDEGRGDLARIVTAARGELGEAAFAEAWAEGRAMKLPQLLAYAAVS